ncbi:MAG: DUF1738 domain-containing protein [Pseudomonadota bacterium]|nr:DUF1738 domain-containing protein [Pseudomonadota bacterium]
MEKPQWSEILKDAVTRPGSMNAAFRAFHNYSVGNMLLAMMQCTMRDIPIGPIATYRAWSALGRQVRRGEKAISLWMPLTFTKTDDSGEEHTRHSFMLKNQWFVLAQTDGEPIESVVIPLWNEKLAAQNLGLIEVPFALVDGNTLGYAMPALKEYAVNPVAPDRLATVLHEMGHSILHTEKERIVDDKELDRGQKEMEAECVALLCLSFLGYNTDQQRGYIQHWYKTGSIDDKNANRIINAANKILKAGEPKAQ